MKNLLAVHSLGMDHLLRGHIMENPAVMTSTSRDPQDPGNSEPLALNLGGACPKDLNPQMSVLGFDIRRIRGEEQNLSLSPGGSALLLGSFSTGKQGVNRLAPIILCVGFVWQR